MGNVHTHAHSVLSEASKAPLDWISFDVSSLIMFIIVIPSRFLIFFYHMSFKFAAEL